MELDTIDAIQGGNRAKAIDKWFPKSKAKKINI